MMHQKAATQQEAKAKTWVIWDIKSCPVLSECDASFRVGRCIKRTLQNLGYSGSVTITAIGHLLDVSEDVLRWVASNGIFLYHIPLDVTNILDAMVTWGNDHQPPANILLITARDFSDGLDYLKSKGFNILPHIEAFPTSTTLESLCKTFLTDTMDTEENSCETSERDWLCSVCGDGNVLVEKFIEHLRSEKHREKMLELLPVNYKLRRAVDEEDVDASFHSNSIMVNNKTVKKAPTQEEAEARTWVIWDMKSCPVPSKYADRVGPCIKRSLEKSGYFGSLTITGIGHLIDFPEDVLRLVLSTGISLHHIPLDIVNVADAMLDWGDANQPPANILLISAREFSVDLEFLQEQGFNILRQILYKDSLGAFPTTTEVESLWESFVTDTMDSEEKSSETIESDWLCSVCVDGNFNDHAGKGFENLTKHLWSLEHRKEMLGWLPCNYKLKRDEDEEEVKAARRNLRLLLERKRKNPEWKEKDNNMALGAYI